MSINSIDLSEITTVSSKWKFKDETASRIGDEKKQKAKARRRIELFNEIKKSGLTIEEAKEMGLLH